ncbi:ribonuclease [Streptomyces sp. WM6373]|uniref:bifunctional RNase H/acid phosphatase n=1 Tax=Streptomyces TaxID=1883 RepID=UPI0004C5ACE6|nr:MULTISPECIES: bifunctional RNase H/acid phosphatase [Streptomyces]KOU31119.1 ribonuclease [Streptomyces sp. WM6373]KOU58198.1 ribonuclease [Streptomyces sp. IGB124]KOU71926.1 ribonuclease [Streptomyces sp. XY66]KOU80949.1 ribonuclease [Streptomyces sp. XY58]KOV01785.1 ribonuclease [Streptomyces sp. XY37]
MPRFVVEADGGSRGNPGPAGYGAVVLDPASGETLAERAEYIGVATNNVAEYKGLIAGLTAARDLAPDAQVLVRMDSKLVVEQMSGRWKIKHPDMKPLAAEAARILPRAQVTYEWIPRERNKHADRLANEAMDAGKRGEQWEPSASSAALDASAARSLSTPPPSGPPGDAAAGAAAARAALAASRGTAAGADTLFAEAEPGPAGTATAPAEVRDRAGHTAAPTAPAAGQGWAPDMGAPATFVLLRHGETALTPQKRFSGSGGSDPELSPAGRRQAAAVAEALAARGTVQTVISSPLLRCRETAQAVADRLGLDVTVEQGLREVDFGAWEGLTFAEVRERFPDDLQAWLDSPKAAPTGGGESFAAATRRISATRDRLLAEHAGRTVLLVTHVTPVKILVRLALGAPPESLFRMELSAASLSAVAYYADGNASVRLLNDTSHLR